MQNPHYAPPAGYGPPPKKGFPVWIIVILLIIPVGLVVLLFVAIMGVYGVRKYIANAKTAEARATLAAIGGAAARSYAENGSLCRSASSPIPLSPSSVSGMKYMSSASEWTADAATKSGFACLGFSMNDAQYFQYSYDATATGFSAVARGDLNADGKMSKYELVGKVVGGKLVLAPNIVETDPFE
jgi:type IV pilus assembly protein PilA